MDTLDHVVIVVPELRAAVGGFGEAGFTVTPGGRHDAIPTENALVAFADGSYLELLAARDPADHASWREAAAGPGWTQHLRGVGAVARRFLRTLAGPDGVGDWCLRTRSLATRAADLRRVGEAASGPVAMARERPDGEHLRWELLLPESRGLPFWIRDVTPTERRVPGGAATVHANGARGVASLVLATPLVATGALALGDVFGIAPSVAPGGTTVLMLGSLGLEFVEAEPPGVRGVRLEGVADLPDRVRALGVLPSRQA